MRDIILTLECDNCEALLVKFFFSTVEANLADFADKYGWILNYRGKDLCPPCKNREH